MVISIDIDGVLVDREEYQLRKGVEWAKSHNLSADIIDSGAYNVHEIFGWSKEDFYEFWNVNLWDYAKLKPMMGVRDVIKKLKDDGHKIIINTSRWMSERSDELGEKMRALIKLWFVENDIPYDELVFACGDKVSGIEKYSADIHIEDNPAEAKPIMNIIPVIIFNAKYNEQMKDVKRAKSWDDVYDIILGLTNNK